MPIYTSVRPIAFPQTSFVSVLAYLPYLTHRSTYLSSSIMQFTTSFTSLVIALAAATTSVLAIPLELQKRDVWDPKILYPHAGTVWKLGATHNVTWDTSDAPVNISNGAAIYLRLDTGPELSPVLAKGFDLRSGRQEITVPKNFTPATDYRIVLFGDSGNWSPEFTITA